MGNQYGKDTGLGHTVKFLDVIWLPDAGVAVDKIQGSSYFANSKRIDSIRKTHLGPATRKAIWDRLQAPEQVSVCFMSLPILIFLPLVIWRQMLWPRLKPWCQHKLQS